MNIHSYYLHREFLASGAPCEINIDGRTMEKVHQEMKNPSRFTFDSAAEHVYTLLLKKDCYPRFIRSDQYRNLLAAGVQPSQKKRYVRNSFKSSSIFSVRQRLRGVPSLEVNKNRFLFKYFFKDSSLNRAHQRGRSFF